MIFEAFFSKLPGTSRAKPDKPSQQHERKGLSRRQFLRLLLVGTGATALASAPRIVAEAAAPEQPPLARPEVGGGDKQDRDHAMQELMKNPEFLQTTQYVNQLIAFLTHYQLRFYGKNPWQNKQGFFEAFDQTRQQNILEPAANFLGAEAVEWFETWIQRIHEHNPQNEPNDLQKKRALEHSIDTSIKSNNGKLTPPTMLRLASYMLQFVSELAPPACSYDNAEIEVVDLLTNNPAVNTAGKKTFTELWSYLAKSSESKWQFLNANKQEITIKLLHEPKAGDRMTYFAPGTVLLSPGTSVNDEQARYVVASQNIKPGEIGGQEQIWYLLLQSDRGMQTDISDIQLSEGQEQPVANGVLRLSLMSEEALRSLLFSSTTRRAVFSFTADKPLFTRKTGPGDARQTVAE